MIKDKMQYDQVWTTDAIASMQTLSKLVKKICCPLIAYSNVPMLITDKSNTDYMKEKRYFGFI